MLHVVSLFNILLVMAVAAREGASANVLALLGLVPVFNISRLIMWRRTKPAELTDAAVRRTLRNASIAVAAGMGLASSLCVYTYLAHVFKEPAIIPVSLAYGTFCVAHSLAPMRKAAVWAIVLGIVPNALIMSASTDFMSVVLSLSAMTVAMLLTRFIFDQYQQMVAGLELEQQVIDMANTDALTGLLNRRGFEAELDAMLADLPEGTRLTVGIVDLDGFKQINDRMGHFAGDDYLARVAGRVAAGLPLPGRAGRLGGDEFIFVLKGPGGLRDVETGIETLLAQICRPIVIGSSEVPVSVSIGYAHFPDDAANAEALLVAADVALYAAKDAGKSCARAYAAGCEARRAVAS